MIDSYGAINHVISDAHLKIVAKLVVDDVRMLQQLHTLFVCQPLYNDAGESMLSRVKHKRHILSDFTAKIFSAVTITSSKSKLPSKLTVISKPFRFYIRSCCTKCSLVHNVQ
ncbi:hypothetical protein J6590_066754 [Homalodisca vitripennis]|nr:hypothetical protein J6590_066754 [Homalodisca vitripennis]